jgi:hypothetical protein
VAGVTTVKIILVRFGIRCLNHQLALGVTFIGWLFQLSLKLRPA